MRAVVKVGAPNQDGTLRHAPRPRPSCVDAAAADHAASLDARPHDRGRQEARCAGQGDVRSYLPRSAALIWRSAALSAAAGDTSPFSAALTFV